MGPQSQCHLEPVVLRAAHSGRLGATQGATQHKSLTVPGCMCRPTWGLQEAHATSCSSRGGVPIDHPIRDHPPSPHRVTYQLLSCLPGTASTPGSQGSLQMPLSLLYARGIRTMAEMTLYMTGTQMTHVPAQQDDWPDGTRTQWAVGRLPDVPVTGLVGVGQCQRGYSWKPLLQGWGSSRKEVPPSTPGQQCESTSTAPPPH